MDDKKHYRDILKVLVAEAKPASIINKLAVLHIDTEDQRIAKALGALLNNMRDEWAHAPPVVKVTPSQYAKTFAGAAGARNILADNIAVVAKYCESMVAAAEPHWAILARRAGWTPPPTPSRAK
jgi:hypothetical protein